jgi:hypothetical protein
VKTEFEVRATYPFSDDYEVTDEVLMLAAECRPSFSSVGMCRDMEDGRELGFNVADFERAARMKNALESTEIDGLVVRVREL